jgi:hypothetical protein
MFSRVRQRFCVEVVLAVATFGMMIATLFSREWIEGISGWDPDRGGGSAELLVVGLLFTLSLSSARWAQSEWRRTRTWRSISEPAQPQG